MASGGKMSGMAAFTAGAHVPASGHVYREASNPEIIQRGFTIIRFCFAALAERLSALFQQLLPLLVAMFNPSSRHNQRSVLPCRPGRHFWW